MQASMEGPRPRRVLLERLRGVGDSQAGFFTAYQAGVVGVDRHRLQRLVASGVLVRDLPGIYRFAAYPEGTDDEYWRALMLTARHDGVLSFETALGLFNVSTVNPATIDITVKRGARIRLPGSAAITLHFGALEKSDITAVRGLPTTTLMRTLIDMILENSGTQFVREALESDAVATHLTSGEREALHALATRPSLAKTLMRAIGSGACRA